VSFVPSDRELMCNRFPLIRQFPSWRTVNDTFNNAWLFVLRCRLQTVMGDTNPAGRPFVLERLRAVWLTVHHVSYPPQTLFAAMHPWRSAPPFGGRCASAFIGVHTLMGYTENSRTVVIASESHIYAEPRQEQEGAKSAGRAFTRNV